MAVAEKNCGEFGNGADGRIVAGGIGGAGSTLVQFNSDGSLDPNFDGPPGTTCFPSRNGKFAINMGGTNWIRSLVLDTNGKIVAVGRKCCTATTDGYIARFNIDGTFDTYGTGGSTVIDWSGNFNEAVDVALQPDGKAVVVGTDNNDLAIARLSTGGVLDGSFGSGGMRTIDLGASEGGYGILAQPDGKAVIGGFSGGNTVFLRTLLSNGANDPSFGTLGVQSFDVSAGQNEAATRIVMTTDGQIVTAGEVFVAGVKKALLVALASTPVDQYADNGLQDWDTGGSLDLFGACVISTLNGATSGGTAWNKDLNTGADCADGSTPTPGTQSPLLHQGHKLPTCQRPTHKVERPTPKHTCASGSGRNSSSPQADTSRQSSLKRWRRPASARRAQSYRRASQQLQPACLQSRTDPIRKQSRELQQQPIAQRCLA